MTQMNKVGKFILIWEDLTLHLPTKAVTEYNISTEGKYIFLPEAKSPAVSMSHGKAC